MSQFHLDEFENSLFFRIGISLAAHLQNHNQKAA